MVITVMTSHMSVQSLRLCSLCSSPVCLQRNLYLPERLYLCDWICIVYLRVFLCLCICCAAAHSSVYMVLSPSPTIFSGKYLEIVPTGVSHLILKESGDHYTWKKVRHWHDGSSIQQEENREAKSENAEKDTVKDRSGPARTAEVQRLYSVATIGCYVSLWRR